MSQLVALFPVLALLFGGLLAVGVPAPLPLSPEQLCVLPGVDKVDLHRSKAAPTRRIIHILDWHFVDEEAWAADLRSQGVSDDEIAESYATHLDEVQAVQAQRAKLLEALIDEHGVTAVYIEGLSAATVGQYRRQLELLRDYRPIVDPDTPLGQLLEAEHQRELMRVGPEGRLAMLGRLALRPAEDAAAYAAANPRNGDVVKFDRAANERREDAVIRNLLKEQAVTVMVFGSAHDFSDNIQKLRRDVEYVRVRLKGLPGRI